MKTTIGIAAVACALVASVGTPAIAVAAPSAAPRSVATTPTPSKRLVHQYSVLARARYNRFKANARVITLRLNRYSAIASRVESRGADVTAVRAHIADARAHVASGTLLASAAAAKLKSVPYVKNRRATYYSAGRGFTAAAWQLSLARADRKRAAADLWPLVKKAHLTGTYRWAEFK
jgi:hypothetical protein